MPVSLFRRGTFLPQWGRSKKSDTDTRSVDRPGSDPTSNNDNAANASHDWLTILKYLGSGTAALSAGIVVLVAGGLGFRQWIEKPIAIGSTTIVGETDAFGITGAALEDQLKVQISTINAESGDLLVARKLVDNAVPLDIKIGNTGWTFATLTKAFNFRFTSADISGRLSRLGESILLEYTIAVGDRIKENTYRIPLPLKGSSPGTRKSDSAGDAYDLFLDRVREDVNCTALQVVQSVSPDIAANYLHKLGETGDDQTSVKLKAEAIRCINADDVELYSGVSKDRTAPDFARVNAFVGLSLHYQQAGLFYEEKTMADAATEFGQRRMPCDDASLTSRWEHLHCVMTFKTSAKNKRALIAAWMQKGAAYSDFASLAHTVGEAKTSRGESADAYRHVLAIEPHYALAFDALGNVLSLLALPDEADKAYSGSLDLDDLASTQIDLGFAALKGRDDVYSRWTQSDDRLKEAEGHFNMAINLEPNYWDAHSRLGYVLFAQKKYAESTDALEVALAHDKGNRYLRRLLASAYADQCNFARPRLLFTASLQEYSLQGREKADFAGQMPKVPKRSSDDQLNILADWGKVLDSFGFHYAAIEQENAVLAEDPKHLDALIFRGLMRINQGRSKARSVSAGLSDLQAAFEYASSKPDFNKQPYLFVKEPYLLALVRVGRADEAVSLYKAWADAGLVPEPISGPSIDPSTLQPNQSLRVIYAKSLEATGRLPEAEMEMGVLAQLGIPVPKTIEDIRMLGGSSVGDEDDSGAQRTCKSGPPVRSVGLKEVAISPRLGRTPNWLSVNNDRSSL